MTKTTTPETVTTPGGKLAVGDVVHFRQPLMVWGDVHPRGASVVLTADMIRRTVDRDGTSWLDRVDDPDGRIGRGPWPTDAPRWVYGDPEWQELRETARRRAWALPSEAERREALAAVEREFGAAPKTSRSAPIREHHTERQAREQAERISRGDIDGRH